MFTLFKPCVPYACWPGGCASQCHVSAVVCLSSPRITARMPVQATFKAWDRMGSACQVALPHCPTLLLSCALCRWPSLPCGRAFGLLGVWVDHTIRCTIVFAFFFLPFLSTEQVCCIDRGCQAAFSTILVVGFCISWYVFCPLLEDCLLPIVLFVVF